MENLNIEEYNQKGIKFLKQVATSLETPDDLAYAERLTAATMSVMRELITTEESLHFISNLPMYLKAVYVNGWKINKDRPRIKTLEEFFALLREKYPRTTGRPLGNYQSVRKDVKALLSVLRNYINEGEVCDIQSQLPEPIANLWKTGSLEENEQEYAK